MPASSSRIPCTHQIPSHSGVTPFSIQLKATACRLKKMNQYNVNYNGTPEKIALFKSIFTGLTGVYGTYDPETGRAWQVKKPVTDEIIRSHLEGRQPYGVYLLDGEQTRAIACDFDTKDPFPPEAQTKIKRRFEPVQPAIFYGKPLRDCD